MPLPPIEMDLPLDGLEPASARDEDEVRTRRRGHLIEVPGVDAATAARLLGAFPTLGSIYAASEEKLSEVVGSVAAARIRWFLDAPLGLPTAPPLRRPHWRSAA
jgi:ERCC4-type nuclease